MTPELHTWVHDDGQQGELKPLKGFVRGHFTTFVRGDEIDDLEFMKLVEDRRDHYAPFDHGVWSIRPSFKPLHRFFGVFALKDWFVAMTVQDRASLGMSQGEWHKQIDGCRTLWNELFPGKFPISGNNVFAYISDNVEAEDDRRSRFR
ncbi:MAG: hypothetical protein ACFCUR_02530 [Rhodomicrobiaceae bacterium]